MMKGGRAETPSSPTGCPCPTAEAEKCERKIAVLRAKGHKHAGLKEAEEASKWMDIRDEMRTNARAMRRRAEKAGEEAEK